MYDTQTAFLMFERGIQALAPRGSRKCPKAMRKLDNAFTEELSDPVIPLRRLDEDARVMLRVRCGLCAKRCKVPLKPVMTRVAAE